MNKTEFTDAVAKRAGITKQDAAKHVEACFTVIRDTVAAGEKVAITGFGAFKPVERPERQSRNPATGATITVPATTVPTFKAGADFKATVAGPRQVTR